MASRLEQRPDGEIMTVVGASGCGKTTWTMRQVARDARLISWDYQAQWAAHGCTPLRSIPELARACSSREPGQLAYIGPVDSFDAFCRVALLWLKLGACTIVIEELAEVTSPGKAPPGWGELVRWAHKLNGRLVVLTQRPQESDKTSLRNSKRIVCFACNGDDDAKYMARQLSVPWAQIASLNYERHEYLERLANRSTRRRFSREAA